MADDSSPQLAGRGLPLLPVPQMEAGSMKQEGYLRPGGQESHIPQGGGGQHGLYPHHGVRSSGLDGSLGLGLGTVVDEMMRRQQSSPARAEEPEVPRGAMERVSLEPRVLGDEGGGRPGKEGGLSVMGQLGLLQAAAAAASKVSRSPPSSPEVGGEGRLSPGQGRQGNNGASPSSSSTSGHRKPTATHHSTHRQDLGMESSYGLSAVGGPPSPPGGGGSEASSMEGQDPMPDDPDAPHNHHHHHHLHPHDRNDAADTRDDKRALTPSSGLPPAFLPLPGMPMRKPPTCQACKKSKVKCDRNSPCARCVRLRLECIPHPRPPGRPLKSQAAILAAAARHAAASSGGHGSASVKSQPRPARPRPPQPSPSPSDPPHTQPQTHSKAEPLQDGGMGGGDGRRGVSSQHKRPRTLPPQPPLPYLSGPLETKPSDYPNGLYPQPYRYPPIRQEPPTSAANGARGGQGRGPESGGLSSGEGRGEGRGGADPRGGEAHDLLLGSSASNNSLSTNHNAPPHAQPAASLASLLLPCFRSRLEAGALCGDKARAVLLSWELWNRVVGGDATRGLLTVVSDLLGLNMPLQPPLRPDYSLHMLDAFLGASTGMDADGSACCWAVYKLGSGSGQGGGAEQMQPLSLECNDRFSAMYVSRREMLTPIADGMARPEALWAHRVVAPESASAFADLLTEVLFATPMRGSRTSEACRVLTCRDRWRLDLLSIVRLRALVSPCGTVSALVLLILPLPTTSPSSGPSPAPVSTGAPARGAGPTAALLAAAAAAAGDLSSVAPPLPPHHMQHQLHPHQHQPTTQGGYAHHRSAPLPPFHQPSHYDPYEARHRSHTQPDY